VKKAVDFERVNIGPFPRYSIQVMAICRSQRHLATDKIRTRIISVIPEIIEVKGGTLTPCILETVRDRPNILNAFDSSHRAVQVGQIS
jgi:hypothetical protein